MIPVACLYGDDASERKVMSSRRGSNGAKICGVWSGYGAAREALLRSPAGSVSERLSGCAGLACKQKLRIVGEK